jgi:hypothetical protein
MVMILILRPNYDFGVIRACCKEVSTWTKRYSVNRFGMSLREILNFVLFEIDQVLCFREDLVIISPKSKVNILLGRVS